MLKSNKSEGCTSKEVKNDKHPEIEKKCITERPLPILKMGKISWILNIGTTEDGENYKTHNFLTKVLVIE